MAKLFKYTPKDFKESGFEVVHMDLNFNIYDKHTDVLSVLKLRNKNKPLKKIELNAKNIDILSVECDHCGITYDYKQKKNKLVIKFKKQIPKNELFSIKTVSSCKPSYHILEGLYYDITPEGCPPTIITQCQQWGFQRIVPCVDEMTAKCTYKTTITADKRYTHILSNGDVAEERQEIINNRSKIVYDNSKTPMAPYLFFLGVGTYDAFQKEFEYPDGDTFMLELLLPPGSDKEQAMKALDILYDCVMWIYLFTGPDTFKQVQKKQDIEKLTRKRDLLKKSPDKNQRELGIIRQKLSKMIKGLRLGYKYTGTVYREIGMQNSDYGGMENVGNTTITTNRIIPFDEMTDASFEYMIRVKIHEYYHNLNGSEVTGHDPFELWLNEAVTCFIEHMYIGDLIGEDYMRLQRVLSLIDPNGVFTKDSGATTMPIIPDGFNDPNELISVVTYVKSPEFIRMMSLMIGKNNFMRGLHNYHQKFSHSNAGTDDFIREMEKASKKHLKRMARVWLKQTGYPKLHVKTKYEEKKRKYTLNLVQKGFKRGMCWEFPVVIALVNKEGKDLAEQTVIVNKPKTNVVFDKVEEPGFVSVNRGYSFYGKVVYKQSIPELMLQVQKDSDVISRFMAFNKLLDIEKTAMLKDKKRDVADSIVDLFFTLLSDLELGEKTGALMLAITESVEDENLSYKYDELYEVRKRIIKAVAKKYKKELIKLYKLLAKKQSAGTYLEREIQDIKVRQVKNMCLHVLNHLDNPEVHKIVKKQFDTAKCASDKVAAFSFLLNSTASNRKRILDDYEKKAAKSHVSYESFLAVVGRNNSKDALDLIKRVEISEHFCIDHSNHQRALYNTFALNKKNSLMTKAGLSFVRDTLIKLVKINEYSCVNILEAFSKINNLEEKYQVETVKALVEVMKKIDKESHPSVYNTIKRILVKSPKAVKAYEKKVKKKVSL